MAKAFSVVVRWGRSSSSPRVDPCWNGPAGITTRSGRAPPATAIDEAIHGRMRCASRSAIGSNIIRDRGPVMDAEVECPFCGEPGEIAEDYDPSEPGEQVF